MNTYSLQCLISVTPVFVCQSIVFQLFIVNRILFISILKFSYQKMVFIELPILKEMVYTYHSSTVPFIGTFERLNVLVETGRIVR